MKNIQALEDLDFCVSPYYWDNNNPSALVKCRNEELKNIGYEVNNRFFDEASINKNDFEASVFDTIPEVQAFRDFIENGQKFGCINITNNNSACFDLLKQMYGSVMYLVFESRMLRKNDPAKKRTRYVIFFTEYSICCQCSNFFLSDAGYLQYIEINNNINKGYSKTFSSIMEKLYRSGFRKIISSGVSSIMPTKEQFYSLKNRERFNSFEISILLWKCILNGYYNNKDLSFYAISSNIIGFGWLPCLFAKDSMNEMDYCILHALEQSEVLNEVNLSKNLSDNSSPFKPGTMKLVSFTEWGKQEPTLIPFQNIIRIDCDRKPFPEISSYKIFTTDGAVYNCYGFNEIDDKPNVKILKNPVDYNATAILSYPSGYRQITSINEDYLITANLNSEKDLVDYIQEKQLRQ